jgi:hypothetical protein
MAAMTRAAVIVLALIWPIGALAAETAIGPDTDSPRFAGALGWISARNAATNVEAHPSTPQQTPHRIAREESTRWSEPTYRYGQREPAPEELPVKGRVPSMEPAGGDK